MTTDKNKNKLVLFALFCKTHLVYWQILEKSPRFSWSVSPVDVGAFRMCLECQVMAGLSALLLVDVDSEAIKFAQAH